MLQGRGLLVIFGLLWAVSAASPVLAQVSGSVTLVSDFRLRGLSLNDGNIAVAAEVAVDHPTGIYAGASVVAGDTSRFGKEVLNHTAYLGYVTAVDDQTTVDFGLSHTQVYSNVAVPFSGSYTEIYAGVSLRRTSVRVSVTPSFIEPGLRAAYIDVNRTIPVTQRLRLLAHVGLLIPLGGTDAPILPTSRFDTRVGVARQFTRGEVQLHWSHTSADAQFLSERLQQRDAIVASASWFF